MWDVATKEKIATVDSGPGFAISAAFSPDGKILAIAHLNGIKVIDANTRETRYEIAIPRLVQTEPITFSPDSTTLTACNGTELMLFELATGKERMRLKDGDFVASPVSFSSDGRRMVSVSEFKVRVWDTTTMTEQKSFSVKRGHSAVISPDGSLVAIGTNGSRKYPGVHTFVVHSIETGERTY